MNITAMSREVCHTIARKMTSIAGYREHLKIVSWLFIALASYRGRVVLGRGNLQEWVLGCIALYVVFSGADTYIRWTVGGM